ncbi:MAG TPA: glycoside hydrolase family 2 TIM barrel-domain containing protein, partial [Pseudonocardia sp.]|nr:glycoside hydrolase family 2 TIM barrel-domain containing protein [Pseudonocardia sp.]
MDHVDDLTPGSGRRTPARARLRTDAPELSLDGEWDFRWAAGGEPDGPWETLPVPAHWVLHRDGRYGRPWYTNVRFPFPIDPPHVPDENPVGEYRRTFAHPGWDVARVLLRVDGVESVYRVVLNGAEVGVGKGSRLVQEFDVTELLVPGRNELVVRVHQWSSMSYVEDQDQWWLPGIFRAVTLLGRPRDGLDDVWLRTGWADGRGTLDPEFTGAFPVTVALPELGVERRFASAADVTAFDVGSIEPWTAETPRLYDATVSSPGETVALRLGFRTVAVDGERFLVNARPVTFRGMNRHETHPERGRVFDEAHARADLLAMKRHNVNAIRTSHYPPHHRVLELADELGFWVVLENDLETHGFEAVGWRGNPSDDPAWEAVYLDRIARTVERDKNHACVVMWSLGNEAGTGRNLAATAHWVRRRDPGRPVHYEGDHTAAYTDVYSRMYPSPAEVAAICADSGVVPGLSPVETARVRTRPFVMCEYAHAMGNGPGALDTYDAQVDASPRHHGGFVWEWRDHGILTRTADGTPFFAYGGDFGEVVHDGTFVMDGMVLPDDTPTPGLAEFAAVNAPVVLTVTAGRLTVVNRYHTVDTAHLRFVAVVEDDGARRSETELAVPAVPAGGSATVDLPVWTPATDAETWVTVRAELAADAPWAARGHVVSHTQFAVAHLVRPSHAPQQVRRSHQVCDAGFDERTGALRRLFGLDVDGPRLELWRAPTDNDRGIANDSPDGRSAEHRWRERGLDRLVHRVVAVDADGPVVRIRVGAAGSARTVDVTYRWTVADEVSLRVEVVPSPDWDCTWPRVGVRFDLPPRLRWARWFGTGPAESYPDSRRAARVGRFAASLEELNVRYSRPQETGHRAELRTLEVGDDTGVRLRLRTIPDPAGHRPGFTLTPHTPQELDRARHPHELAPPTHTCLFLDDAVHGLGSAA